MKQNQKETRQQIAKKQKHETDDKRHETTQKESEALELELDALEYHTRAMATPEGIKELEKQLSNLNI